MSIVIIDSRNGLRRETLTPQMAIGKGGEADVYLLDKQTVLKRYKEPADPDYALDPGAQLAAKVRLKEQVKKLPAFPKGLPPEVITPDELAYADGSNRRLVGYTMRYLDGMEVLMKLGDRSYRDQGGIDGNQVVRIFRKLHQMVRALHAQGVVIGDFNDLNVLFDANDQAYLVDADSMQFGQFLCNAFTARFVDPLRCAPNQLMLNRPHNEQSDWYAYAVMLLQSLLYVGPYGGVHRPSNGPRLQHDARVLKRLTVFEKSVVYPKPAIPFSTLPDDLLNYLHKVFERDQRGEFPDKLLGDMRWTTCKNCGLMHARASCPGCAAPGVVKQTVVIRGKVTATRLFQTKGRLLHTVYQNGKLCYLYHEAGTFRREDGQAVLPGDLDPEVRFRIHGDSTLLGKRDRLFVIAPGQAPERLSTETYRKLSMFDANDQHYYWLDNGRLVMDGFYGNKFIGTVLSGQTLFWVGKKFGFGFYQAGQLLRAFVFDAQGRGLNDQVPIPNLPGQLVDATCVFSDNLAWFMVGTQEAGQLKNSCFVIDARGNMVASDIALQGEDSWLAHGIRGHLAVGGSLYAATDEGIVQLTADGGRIYVHRTFPDTESFVSSATQLLPAPTGMYAVSNQEIVLLEIK
jgi:hypothetical protein